jgi:rhodanese-related sulfurtransferase
LDSSFWIFLQKNPINMMLFATALVTGGMLLWPLFNRLFSGGVPQVGAIEAVQLINRRDALVLDVRDKTEFAAGHVPNARNIPLKELEGRLREIEKFKSRPVVINCVSDGRSAAVCATLKKGGFGEVFVLRDGLRGWAGSSLPVEKQK